MGELLFWILYLVVQVVFEWVFDIFTEICQVALEGMWYHITGRY
jgi:hypothetical protein